MIVVIVALAAILIFKPWGCSNPTVPAKSSINADSLALAQQKEVSEKQAETIDSQTGTIDSLVQSNLVLANSLDNCQGKKTGHRRVVKPPVTHLPAASVTNLIVDPPLSTYTVTASEVPADVIRNFCGTNGYVIVTFKLNKNDGNYWPQIVVDRDATKTFNHAVPNPDNTGINFKFFVSDFVDQPNGEVCVTKDGRICVPASYVSEDIGPDKIIEVIIWTGTIRGFHQMTLSGNNYIFTK